MYVLVVLTASTINWVKGVGCATAAHARTQQTLPARLQDCVISCVLPAAYWLSVLDVERLLG